MELHPAARDVLQTFATEGYFRSNRLCQTLAQIDPLHCLNWAVRLVKHRLNEVLMPDVVGETLQCVQSGIQQCSPDLLPRLDELASKCWCCGIHDESAPFVERAFARLAWATMCWICHATPFYYASAHVDLHHTSHGWLLEMTNQCAMAIDMTNTRSEDGRLMVAASFTREMVDMP